MLERGAAQGAPGGSRPRLGARQENGEDRGDTSVDDGEAPYLLAPHVHLCVCGRHVVLMDLRRDRYVAAQPAHLLAGWVRGWPGGEAPPQSASGSGRAGPHGSRAPALLSKLLAQGMLVQGAGAGRPATPLALPVVQRTLLEFDFDRPPMASAADLRRFALAWARARSSLALRPIHSIVAGVRARKAHLPQAAHGADPKRERELLMTFVHLRPLFYTVRRACLLDSLTLVHFLAASGVYPEWVFGVRTAPFDAHCWVQRGEVLFNDSPDRVRQYSPILLV